MEVGSWKLENGNRKREVAWHPSATVRVRVSAIQRLSSAPDPFPIFEGGVKYARDDELRPCMRMRSLWIAQHAGFWLHRQPTLPPQWTV